MADLLTKPRQLAPTMGQNASGARIQAGSAFAGIGDTITIGRILYDSGFPIVPTDNLWVPVMSMHFYSCRHLLALQVQRFVEQQQVSLKWITQGL
jgi:hypothetical protein